MKQIVDQWGNTDNMINEISDRFMKIQGSGWAWLVYCQTSKRLTYKETKDQDPICLTPNEIPLLAIDAWEHAWYVTYRNKKKEYATNIWKVINWKYVEQGFENAVKH